MTSNEIEPLTWLRIGTGYYWSGNYSVKQDTRPGVTFWTLRYCGQIVRSNFDTMRDAKRAAAVHKAERS
jgi:hypothetical protein